MKGILKNKDEGETESAPVPFDRKMVIENTRRNAREGRKLREERENAADEEGLATEDQTQDRTSSLSPLRWDEKNLLINEREKCATMKIDEPKTPYEGGFNPNNNYYREDNEDENDEREGEGDDEFVLGEAEDEQDFIPAVIDQDQEARALQEQQEAHKKETDTRPTQKEHESAFERMRKMHYKMEAKVRPSSDDDDNDDDDDEDDD